RAYCSERHTVRFGGRRLETQVMLCAGRPSYFLLGFAGPLVEAHQIKERISTFLATELKLTLSAEKTLITHAHTGRARFLGYEIGIMECPTKLDRTRGTRTVNGKVGLYIPKDVI